MRITKIHWKRFSRPIVAGAFFVFGVVLAIALRESQPGPEPVVIQSSVETVSDDPAKSISSSISLTSSATAEPVPSKPIQSQYSGWFISGYFSMGGRSAYTLSGPDGRTMSLDTVAKKSVDILPRDNCHVRLISKIDLQDFVDLYSPDCIPDSARSVVNNGIDVIPDTFARRIIHTFSTDVAHVESKPVHDQMARK